MTVTPLKESGASLQAATPLLPSTASRHALGDLLWSPSRAARWARRGAVSLALLFGLVQLSYPIRSLAPGQIYMKDFLQEYLLARAIAEGVDPYLPLPVLIDRFLGAIPVSYYPYSTPHPPTAGLLLLPLALLDYPSAAAVWVVLELACLVASVHLLARLGGVRLGWVATLLTATIVLPWHPFLWDLGLGQLMLPILLLVTGAQRALLLERRVIGGALLGLSLLLKPIAWPLLLVLGMYRNWRALTAAVSIGMLGGLASTWIVGVEGVVSYITQVLPVATRLYQAASLNISVWTIGWRLFDGTGSEAVGGVSAPPLVQSATVATMVSAALPALILLASLIAIRRQRSLSKSFGLTLCVSILISPIAWAHYLALAAIPAVQVGSWMVRQGLPSRETNVALVVALMLLPGDNWLRLALRVAGPTAASGATAPIPFAPALLTLGPAVAVAALALLLITVREVADRTLDGQPCPRSGDRVHGLPRGVGQ